MKNFFLIIIMLAGSLTGTTQERPQYAISAIPDSLKKDVNSVVIEQSDILLIRKPGKGKQIVKSVVAVLNDKAEDELIFRTYYDQFHKIEDIEINIYDANGKTIRRSRKKDLTTMAVGDGISIVNDDKMIRGDFRSDKYPVTIEINYEIIFEGILSYQDFYPQTSDQSIVQKSYTITTTTDNDIRYKNYRCAVQPLKKLEGNLVSYTWKVSAVAPFHKEPGSATNDIPHVKIAPTLFEMDDYPGSLASWKNFGLWINSLNQKMDVLPAQSQAYYRDLVKNAGSDREKIAILYKHMQDNYRYVSISLGIGGFKPFPADFVEKKKYGDCKALSNYMRSVLQAVNIKSYYTIIYAGNDRLPPDDDFPEHQFNHAILCVPMARDTVWLECTSRTIQFGRLGTSTENRKAVLATENGGVLTATPVSKAEDNTMHTTTIVQLNADGSGKASIDTRHTGEFTDMTNYVLDADEPTRKRYLINYIGYKQPDAVQLSKTNVVNQHDYVLHYDMEFEKVPDFIAGSKYFMSPRLYKFWNEALPKTEKRETSYYLEAPQIQSDSTVYQLPDGFAPETLPKAASIKCTLGSYEAVYTYDEAKKQVISTCRIVIRKHIIPANLYQETATFFSDVIKEQQQRIVIKKQ